MLLLTEPWTMENGLLTPTMKLKRAKVVEKFAEDRRTVRGTLRCMSEHQAHHPAAARTDHPRGGDAVRCQLYRRHFRRLDHGAGGSCRQHPGGAPGQGPGRHRGGQFLRVQAADVRRRRGQLLRQDREGGDGRRLRSTSRSMRSAIRPSRPVVKVTEATLTYVAVDDDRRPRVVSAQQ